MQCPSPVAESALVAIVTFLFSTIAVSELPVEINLLKESAPEFRITPDTICSTRAVSVIRKRVVLVKAVLPAKNLSSAIASDQAYPLPGAWSRGMSIAMLLAVFSCDAVRVNLNGVKDVVAIFLIFMI
jgi:hypothetical protein